MSMSSHFDAIEINDASTWLVDGAEGETDAPMRPAIPLLQQPAGRATRMDDLVMCRLAREEYDERARRLKFFHQTFLGEPAWDILLDLYINEVTGLRASVTSVCIASRVPQTTAIKVIGALIEKGLVERASDPLDRRRHWVTMSNRGYVLMRDYLEARAIARQDRPFIFSRSTQARL